ncbi:MAG: carbohydrate ABC transporter substrate-binding protein [Lachnospiraceae bacterium]|nr:carbohydrate ABC transporter substrate-binding protein [Lachnospiraceae bacterium]
MVKFGKKVAVWLLLGALLTGCGEKEKVQDSPEEPDIEIEQDSPGEVSPEEEIPQVSVLSDLEAEITWWVYPIFVQGEGGAAGDYEQELIAQFQQYYPNIRVNLEMLDYENGPARLEEAVGSGTTPDVLFDQPGRIQGYAQKGVLADLSALFTEERKADLVNQEILSACSYGDAYVMYPLSMMNYVMAFNKQMLETCGALELLNREGARTWNTDTFAQVLERLNSSGFKAGSLYCSGVAGDYATRSFLTNLYDVPLMNGDLSGYAFQGEGAVNTMQKVKEWTDLGWLLNGSGTTGAGSVEEFVSGQASYTLLWGLPQAISNAQALEEQGIQVVEMPYPSQDGVPVLEYIMNGFCVFDHQDEARLQASQYFIDFICNGEDAAGHVVRTGAFPVRASLGDVYQGNEQAVFYEALTPYSGVYYQKVQGFEAMRVYWYQMISEVLNGEYGAEAALESFTEYANDTLKGN